MKKFLRKISNWESWPFQLLYTPMAPFWGWYMLRSGAVWFFTPSNPKLTFGGMEGEPKREMYNLLPKHLYPRTFNVLPTQRFDELPALLHENNISYPFIVKPEMGGQGILFRKVDDEETMRRYHSLVPTEYIVQELIRYPVEVSIFHIRHPAEEKGIITGFLHKIPLQVTGNGTSTLEQLVMTHAKAAKRYGDLHVIHEKRWHDVVPAGEQFMLSYAANHNRGAHFIDLASEITEELTAVFDKISRDVNDFYYGRYDVMCSSIEDLKAGKNFSILEYNGCGAEPNHFYDTGYTLFGAYREILKHWRLLFDISRYNARTGIKPWPFMKGMRFRRDTGKLYDLMKKADKEIG